MDHRVRYHMQKEKTTDAMSTQKQCQYREKIPTRYNMDDMGRIIII